MPRRAARIDTTARELTKLARELGADVLPVNGVIDAVFLIRGTPVLVDFKTPKTWRGKQKTAAQQALVNRGWPIMFVSTAEQLYQLLGIDV